MRYKCLIKVADIITVDSDVTLIEGGTIRVDADTSGSRWEAGTVLGAEGVDSRVRQLAFRGWSVKATGTSVWSFWIPDKIDAMPRPRIRVHRHSHWRTSTSITRAVTFIDSRPWAAVRNWLMRAMPSRLARLFLGG